MSRWVAVPQPSAELEQEQAGSGQRQGSATGATGSPDASSGAGEETTVEGNKITYFRTRFGVRFARVVEPTGFVLWLQEMP